MGRGAVSHTASIFAKADIAPMMDAVLDRGPMTADDIQQFVVAQFPIRDTGGVVADLVARRLGAWREGHAFTPHGHDLPAAAQTDFFRRHRTALQPPPFQAPVVLLPSDGLIRGEKPAFAAGVGRVRGRRSDCL